MDGLYRTRGDHTPLIQQYLTYYLAVRNSDHPFELVDLHHTVSTEDLRQYIQNNLNTVSCRELDFLCAELIRRLKLGNGYTNSIHTWPENTDSLLHKENICDLFESWANQSNDNKYFGYKRDGEKLKRETWKIHLLGENELNDFPLTKQNIFYRDHFIIMLFEHCTIGAYNCDLRWVNLSNDSFPEWFWAFENTDLRYANLSFLKGVFLCKKVSLANANLKRIIIQEYEDIMEEDNTYCTATRQVHFKVFPYFYSVDLTKADLSDSSFSKTEFKNCNFTETIFNNTYFKNKTSFIDIDFRKVNMNGMIFDTSVTFRNCLITQSQYDTYFKNFDRALFQIEPDPLPSNPTVVETSL